MHSKYSTDRSFQSQCQGHKDKPDLSSPALVPTSTTVTDGYAINDMVSTTTEIDATTMSSSIVRARLIVPNISLKSDSKEPVTDIESNFEDESYDWDSNWEVTYEYEYIDEDTDSVNLPEITGNDNLVDNKVNNGKLESINKSDIIQPAQKPQPDQPPAAELCCGDYTDHRFPYYTKNRGCCGGQTFDRHRKQCCNGIIRDITIVC